MIRSDVRPRDLPGDSGHSTLVSDVSSFKQIAEKAYEVFTFCGKRQRLPGWAEIGQSLAAMSSFCPRLLPGLPMNQMATDFFA